MHTRAWTSYALCGSLALAVGCGSGDSNSGDSSSSSGGSSSSGSAGSSGSGGSSGGSSGSGSGASSGASSGSSSGTSSGGSSGTSGGSSSGGPGDDGGADAATDSGGGDGSIGDPNKRKMLLHDEGLMQLIYVDLANPAARWSAPVADGNDMQLVGNNRVMLGTGNGYEEHDLTMMGAKVAELTTFPGTLSAHRLRSGNTLLAGLNWQGKTGIAIVSVNAAGTVVNTINYAGFDGVRLVRETPQGTYLVAANHVVFEGKTDGTVLWKTTLTSTIPLTQPLNSWKALRIASGDVVVATGHAANFQIIGSDHMVHQTFTGSATVAPYFFGNFQVLPNGDYLVANWEGHGTTNGTKGHQILEFDPTGNLVWSWKQDPTYISTIQDVILLDGLDPTHLYVEDTTGMPVAVP
jgi:hypothetical protein